MSEQINPPRPQTGPVAFLGICLFGIGISVRDLTEVRIGTEPWWAIMLLIVIIVGGLLVIIGGWLFVQREVVFGAQEVVVRRWLECLTGRPGRTMPLDAGTRAAITLENIRSVRLEHDGSPPIVLTLGYWDPRTIRALVDAIHARGIPLAQYWTGFYPPGT